MRAGIISNSDTVMAGICVSLGRAFFVVELAADQMAGALEIIMFTKSLFLSGIAASILSAPAFAQTTDDEIIVTSSRLNQTQTEVGSSVSVISQDDIEKLGFGFAVDAIAAAPGVTVNQNGSFGGQASVRIRGASSEQTLVLFDGVTVNDPSSPGGGLNFSRIDTNSIEKIEILKGPQSTLWGTDAIGGVVSITTKRPEPGFGGNAFAEYGSFNTLRGGASVNGSNDTGDFRLALTGIDTDGISKADEVNGNTENDGYTSYTLSGRGGINLPANAHLDVMALYTDAETEFDSFVFGDQGNVGDGDELNETQELSGKISLKLPLLEGRLENVLTVGYSDIDRQNFTNGASSFGAEGDRTTLRYQGTLNINESNTVAFGAEHEESTANDESTTIDGVFALYEFKPTDKLTLTGGVRLDDHERFGSETTGRVAAAYNPFDVLTLRASWGQGFKAPTIFQTTFFCCGATQANVNLQPERSDAFDIGAELRTPDGRGQAGVTYFNQDVENLITFSFADGGYSNIVGADTKGFEVFGNYQITEWLNVAANYAYLNATDNTGGALVRVPKNSGDVTVSIDPKGPFSGAILARFNGEEADSNGMVENWTRIDLNAAYALNDSVEFYGRIENLFDEQYQQIIGYGTPGLSGSVGVRLQY